MGEPTPDSVSVYHAPESSDIDRPQPPLRAFFVEVYDEDDQPERAYYGVARAEGGAIAQGMRGNGIHVLGDVDTFAARIGGDVVWV